MNIKNRLRKLENQMEIGGAFCLCAGVPKYELLRADLSARSDSAAPVPKGEPVPDVCAECRKPIKKQQFILELCDQTTKDRFPELWSENNYEH